MRGGVVFKLLDPGGRTFIHLVLRHTREGGTGCLWLQCGRTWAGTFGGPRSGVTIIVAMNRRSRGYMVTKFMHVENVAR
jgi:hypothetical protein